MGIHWPEVITNEELWTTTEQERINIQIRRRKWGWIGHTLRKTNCNVTKQALRWNPQGKRSRGRPRNSWRRTIDDEASKAGYTWTQIERIAQNRTRWRAVVSVDLCSMGSERMKHSQQKNRWRHSYDRDLHVPSQRRMNSSPLSLYEIYLNMSSPLADKHHLRTETSLNWLLGHLGWIS
ncbi:hypothetical protein ACROYT_G002008 [Oculina patagonica]